MFNNIVKVKYKIPLVLLKIQTSFYLAPMTEISTNFLLVRGKFSIQETCSSQSLLTPQPISCDSFPTSPQPPNVRFSYLPEKENVMGNSFNVRTSRDQNIRFPLKESSKDASDSYSHR